MSEAFIWPELRNRSRDPGQLLHTLREQAAEEGRRCGRAEGLEAGRAAARAEVEAMRAQLTAALTALDTQVTRFAEQQADVLADLLHGLCGKVLGYELRTNRDALQRILDEALARLDGAAGSAEVHLHPEDHAVVAPGYQGRIAMHADPGVAPGSVSVRLPTQAADFQPLLLIDELFDEVRDDTTD